MWRSMWWVLTVVACGDVESDKKVDARTPDTATPVDTQPIDAPPNTARCNPTAAFGTLEPLTELNSAAIDGGGSLSPDELTVYFASYRTGVGTIGSADIYVATRPNLTSPFGAPALLAVVNTTSQDEWPAVTADGLFMYLDRYGAGTTGWDIYVAQRANTSVDFSTPTLVTSANATGAVTDANQFVMANHSALYFSSSRISGGMYDIYRAQRNVGGTYDTLVAVITSSASEQTASVTADELTMLYSADGPNSMGGNDIYIVKRTTTSD